MMRRGRLQNRPFIHGADEQGGHEGAGGLAEATGGLR
jgi:hypothetical protein